MTFLPSTYIDKLGDYIDDVPAATRQVTVIGDGQRVVEELPHIPPDIDETPHHEAIVPVAVPIPFGHGIGEKAYKLHDENLRTILEEIHPFYGHWITCLTYLHNHYGGYSISAPNHEFNGRLIMDIPSDCSMRKRMTVDYQVLPLTSEMANAVTEANKRASANFFMTWYRYNKDQYANKLAPIQGIIKNRQPPTPATPQYPAPQANTGMYVSAAKRAQQRHTKRTAAVFKLFLGTMGTDKATRVDVFELPDFSLPLINALAELTPAQALAKMRRSIKTHVEDQKMSTHYMNQRILFPMAAINTSFAGAIREANIRNSKMNSSDEPVNASLTLFNFLPPDTGSNEYKETKDQNNQVLYEVMNNEHESKRTKTSSGLYIHGRQNDLNHVLNTLANAVCFLTWLPKDKTTSRPDIIKDMQDMFSIASLDDFQSVCQSWKSTAPWLAHALIQHINNLFRLCATFAIDDRNVSLVLDNQELDMSKLKYYKAFGNAIRSNWNNLMHRSSLGDFAAEPIMYKLFTDTKPTKKTKNNDGDSPGGSACSRTQNQQQHQQQQRRPQGQPGNPSRSDIGFLLIDGRAPRAPTLVNGKELCLGWCSMGCSCPSPRNCLFAHCRFPWMNGIERDRTTVKTCVCNHPNVRFTEQAMREMDNPNRTPMGTHPGMTPNTDNSQQPQGTTDPGTN